MLKISSVQVHKLLMSRFKRKEESVQEYVLVMREIGSRANIEPEVIIQCIIEGIPDDSANKVVLYGAKKFAELKEKIKIYDQIRQSKPAYTSGKKHDSKSSGQDKEDRGDIRRQGYR